MASEPAKTLARPQRVRKATRTITGARASQQALHKARTSAKIPEEIRCVFRMMQASTMSDSVIVIDDEQGKEVEQQLRQQPAQGEQQQPPAQGELQQPPAEGEQQQPPPIDNEVIVIDDEVIVIDDDEPQHPRTAPARDVRPGDSPSRGDSGRESIGSA